MGNSQKPYYMLFNAATDAISALEAQNFGQAKKILVEAQQVCEEWVLSHPEDGDEA